MSQPQAHIAAPTPLSRNSSAVLQTLLYFDVFSHPLSASEISEFCNDSSITRQEVVPILDELKTAGMLRQQGELFTVGDDNEVFVRRLKGNDKAKNYLKIARKISTFISLFPFVRGVMISGSLSKGFMDDGSDIDYFIITEKQRLWMCRSLLAAFRKMLPGRLRKYFCINYFIDTATLEIPEKNIFTATEIAFINPVYNPEIYQLFIESNAWVRSSYFPNKQAIDTAHTQPANHFIPRRILEGMLRGRLGSVLENRLHRFMSDRWQKKFRAEHMKEEFELNYRTRSNAAKQHEKGHQAKILNLYANNILAFEQKHGIILAE